jgi:hypothetical protein
MKQAMERTKMSRHTFSLPALIVLTALATAVGFAAAWLGSGL